MPDVIFESDRRFQMWRYTVSHGQLLLRSTRDGSRATRVDVLFKNVAHVDLPTVLSGLSITPRDAGFALSGDGWFGSVEADACNVAEDEGEYYDPSPFAESLGSTL